MGTIFNYEQTLPFSLMTGARVKVRLENTKRCVNPWCPGHKGLRDAWVIIDNLAIEGGGRSGFVMKMREQSVPNGTFTYLNGYWRVGTKHIIAGNVCISF